MVFLKEFLKKNDFEKKSADDKKHVKLPRRQRVNEPCGIQNGHNLLWYVTTPLSIRS